jgi:YVTN family beta-propeller protein
MNNRQTIWNTLKIAAALALCAAFASSAFAEVSRVSNGKSMTPIGASNYQQVGNLPMNMVLSPDGKFAFTTDMGFHESLWCLNARTGVGIDHIVFGNPELYSPVGLYFGLAVQADGKGTYTVYAGQGSNNTIAVIDVASNGTLTKRKAIQGQDGDFTTGIALDGNNHLYVVNNEYYTAEDAITGAEDVNSLLQPGSLAIYDLGTDKQIARVPFYNPFGKVLVPGVGALPFVPTTFPLAIAVLQNGTKAYVTSQRDGLVYVVDPVAGKIVNEIPVGSHPIALLFNQAQTLLYVANAHSDTVSIFNTSDDSLAGTLLLRPTGAEGLVGATPTNLALSADGNTLYASLGDMNAVAVADVSNPAAPSLQGYIPTGWYPTAVQVTPWGKLMIANGKGIQARYPSTGYIQWQFNNNPQYDLNQIEGDVEIMPAPSQTELAKLTALVLDNNRIDKIAAPVPPVIAGIGVGSGKITHVIYVIKENRTYDQVLGDDPRGNGDPKIALFGRKVTPNLHALENRFVLLDNFYCCSEASGDGWPWSTQSIANEYVVKNLPYNYSGRGRNYDFEGQNNGYPVGGFAATNPDGVANSEVWPNGGPTIPDVSEAPGGHIWDEVAGAGLTYRNYGFFETYGVTGIIPDNFPCETGLREPGHDLAGHTDIDYRRFDTSYADSDAPSLYGTPYPTATYGKHSAGSRFEEFKTEFNEMLAQDSSGATVPNFMMVRLMSDHTAGLASGSPSPLSHVADNDFGVGQLVDLISHSAIWAHTAIFVIEDDAQDGPDHVDCHRSTAYVISPYITQAAVDHTFYNTDSILKTMEDLLGLPPMSQYDAVATPIMDWDPTGSNLAAYDVLAENQSIVNQWNPSVASLPANSPMRRLVAIANKMDFIHPDSAPDALVNEMLWKSVRGASSVMPAPRHTLSLTALHGGSTAAKSATAKADDDD